MWNFFALRVKEILINMSLRKQENQKYRFIQWFLNFNLMCVERAVFGGILWIFRGICLENGIIPRKWYFRHIRTASFV